MKKILFVTAFFATSFLNAQDNWDTVIVNGMGSKVSFNQLKVFQGKIYTAGADSNASLKLFSSASGLPGSFVNEPGLNSVLQGSHEKMMTSVTANNTYMFMGTGVDTVKYNPAFFPAVYRFDGTTYTKHGSIPFDTTGYDSLTLNSAAYIQTMALYSPTGSNDTVYAFAGNTNCCSGFSVWKAPAGVTNPTWVNAGRFPFRSAYDAIVWHKKLYVAVEGGFNGGIILRTADGENWDTVATAGILLGNLGAQPPFYGVSFTAFEIFHDTLVAGLGNSRFALWCTADSLSTTQNWTSLINGNNYNFYWDYITDLQVVGNRIWIEAEDYSSQLRIANPNGISSAGYFPVVWQYSHADSLQRSSSTTDVENYPNSGIDFKLAYFNNKMYTAGNAAYPFIGTNTMGNFVAGEVWHLKFPQANITVNPFCVNAMDSVKSNSVNSLSSGWYLDGSPFATSYNFATLFPGPGIHTVKLRAYSGTMSSGIYDTATYNFTVHSNPIIDSVTVSNTTICQGQNDIAHAYVRPGSGPYDYGWTQSLNIIGLNDSIVGFTLYTVSTPSPSPIGFFVLDSNGCQTSYPGTLYITVNASDSLSGLVIDTLLAPVTAGQVYLFKLNPLNPSIGDTSGLMGLNVSGKYYFPSVYYGDYIVKAIADTSNALYKTSVGTYYSNRLYPFQWDSALVIQHHSCVNGNNAGNDIKILQMPGVTPGPGMIDGIITKDSTYTGARYAGGGLFPTLGAPLKGVDVKLGKNPGGSPAARTTTDTSGHFSFPNVPLGNYKIYVDIPNYGMDSVRTVSLTGGSPTSINNNYYVDSNMIRVIPVALASTSICQGDSIMLQNAYQTLAGTYTDTLNVHGHDSLVITTLSVKALPTLTVSTSADTICVGNSAVLTATGNAASYLWSANAGSLTTATVSVSPSTTTIYTITGTLNACPVSQTIKVVVKSCIGIQTINQNGFDIYPNPAIDKLYVQSQKSASLKIVSIVGQVVLEQSIEMGLNEINLSNLPAGAYAVSINSKGQIISSKLMISK